MTHILYELRSWYRSLVKGEQSMSRLGKIFLSMIVSRIIQRCNDPMDLMAYAGVIYIQDFTLRSSQGLLGVGKTTLCFIIIRCALQWWNRFLWCQSKLKKQTCRKLLLKYSSMEQNSTTIFSHILLLDVISIRTWSYFLWEWTCCTCCSTFSAALILVASWQVVLMINTQSFLWKKNNPNWANIL